MPRHHRFRFRVKTLLVTVTAVALLIACIRLIPGGSAGGSLSNGRMVVTFSDSLLLTSTFSTDTATIHTAGMTIVVEPTRLIVDGEHVANVNEDASDVEVRVERGKVAFLVDGERVQTGRQLDSQSSQLSDPVR